VGKRPEGEKAYTKLCRDYPNSIGIRTSHIDALLYKHDYRAALTKLEDYGFTKDETRWIAYQWGRTYIGLHRYGDAIPILETIVAGQDTDPHFFVQLARALHEFGAYSQAIDCLQRGDRRFKDNVSILTALGAELEYVGKPDRALQLLQPLFETRTDNVRAALGIIRAKLKASERAEAEAILRTIQITRPPEFEWLVALARAEIAFEEGKFGLGIAHLMPYSAVDPSVLELLLAGYHQWALASSGNTRREIVQKAQRIQIPGQHVQSAPVQRQAAKIATVAGDQESFLAAIDNLRATRMDLSEIVALEAEWSRLN
jgi:predicted Zn-dependent protease